MRLGIRIGVMRKAHRDISKLIPKLVIDKNGHQKKVYVRIKLPTQEKGTKVENEANKPVQHDGEFVLTSGGSKDFGEISPEIARKIRRQTGKIRLRVGEQLGKSGDYGEKHIERKERIQELRSNGYKTARDFVQDVTNRYTAIYGGESGRIIIYKKINKKGISLFVELFPSSDGDFYDVKTGMVTRGTYYKNKKPLWERTQSG